MISQISQGTISAYYKNHNPVEMVAGEADRSGKTTRTKPKAGKLSLSGLWVSDSDNVRFRLSSQVMKAATGTALNIL
jgi:hypothetical protein